MRAGQGKAGHSGVRGAQRGQGGSQVGWRHAGGAVGAGQGPQGAAGQGGGGGGRGWVQESSRPLTVSAAIRYTSE